MDDGEWNQIKLIKEMKTDQMNINRWNVDKWIKCKSDIMVSCDKMLVCYKKLSSHKHYLVKKSSYKSNSLWRFAYDNVFYMRCFGVSNNVSGIFKYEIGW